MANNSTSESSKAYFGRYNPEAQRRKRLERHLKKHPEDVQAQEALKDPKMRKKPSKKKNGWLTNDMTKLGFFDPDPKKAIRVDHVNPKRLAWVRSIMRKAETQRQHEQNYTPKAERAKGGKNK